MIDKREIKRLNIKIGKYLDPLALFLLFAVFILPALAVINLSPRAKSVNNVLGAASKQELSVVLVGGTHDYLNSEKLSFPNEKMTTYQAAILKHEKGEYSKPILQVKNTFNAPTNIEISGGTQTPTGSPISLIFDNTEYTLQDESGSPQTINIKVKEQSTNIMYLRFDSKTSIGFDENFELNIVQK